MGSLGGTGEFAYENGGRSVRSVGAITTIDEGWWHHGSLCDMLRLRAMELYIHGTC